ncbi:Origin of replication complex subunit 5-like protein [Drosera capensis]
MGSEKIPQNPRRAARSTSSTASTPTNPIITHKPSLKDLILGPIDDPFALNDLISSFPGRGAQITQILSLLGPLDSPLLPLFVYGGASTGKTSVVLQVFRHLKRPFVYASCASCYNARVLFECVLNQVLFHRRDSGNSYGSAKRCERLSEFVNLLRDALRGVLDELMERRAGRVPEAVKGKMVYVIIDNLEVVRGWDKSAILLPFLFGLCHSLGMPEVGFIFISKASPDAYYSDMGYLEPIPVYFPAYTEKDLREILMRKQENPKLYSYFLDIVLKQFYRTTRRLDELSTSLSRLYEMCCESSNGQDTLDAKRRLFRDLEPHVTAALNEVFSMSSGGAVEDGQKAKGKRTPTKPRQLETIEEMDFHMATSAKYLLLSAFLSSRNPATHDASLFDSTSGLANQKRKRKTSKKVIEHKEMVEQDLLMKGPGTFHLERLLAIYELIVKPVSEIAIEGEEPWDNLSEAHDGEEELMSDVLLQLSSLCSANFISKGASCPLEGSIRYKCTISEELAMKIAKSLKFPLPKYLVRR